MLINITLYTDTRKAAQSDDLADCVDYDALSQKVRHHTETAQRFTVEALAGDIAELCLNEKGIEKVRVRVEKPDALDYVDQVGVEIKRP
jgi:FolB domain-containing protein